MKYIVIICAFFQTFLYSQREYAPAEINYVQRKGTVYFKDSWKPFSGISKSSDEKTYCVARIVNGFVTYSEVFDHSNKLLYKVTDTEFESKYDSISKKSEFVNFKVKYDISGLKVVNTMVYYNKTGNNQPKKIHGFVQTENEKFFYENGILSKIERYYDNDCSKISERIMIFHSPIGNIAYEADAEYTSTFQTFYEDGSLKNKGIYKNDDYLWNN